MKTKTYWSSLSELEQTPEFQAALAREFPDGADKIDGVDRRRFLQLMGASTALAGAGGCRWEKTELLPYTNAPENRVSGIPVHYATSMELSGVAQPLVLTSFEGRPVKVEGNDLHPDSGGACTVLAQASILGLYDPDRSQEFLAAGQAIGVDAALAGLAEVRATYAANGGAGLSLLLRETSSPALQAAVASFTAALPQAQVYRYEPVGRDSERAGTELAYGRAMRVQLRLEKARRIASFESDLLDGHPSALRNTKAFSAGRKPESEGGMNRLYAIESRFTTTGASADHRLAVRPTQVLAVMTMLEAALVQQGNLTVPSSWGQASTASGGDLGTDDKTTKFVAALADDLLAHRGTSLVVAGPEQPADAHALAQRINTLLGNVGETVLLSADPLMALPGSTQSLSSLVQEMRSGNVQTLAVLDGNPAYDAPRGLDFKGALGNIEKLLHLGLFCDETGELAAWHIPAAHYLESWGDTRAWDGSYCVIQPMLRPLYGGKSVLEVVDYLSSGEWPDAQALVRAAFNAAGGGTDDKAWQRAQHDGFLRGSEAAHDAIPGRALPVVTPDAVALSTAMPDSGNLELVLHADPRLYDGRFANNGWLQELPDYLTKLTWDNALLMGPATAEHFELTHGDMVSIGAGSETLDVPVWIQPGQARGTLSLTLGHGRIAAGHVGGLFADATASTGFDAYTLTGVGTVGFVTGVSMTKTGGTFVLASTQEHHLIDAKGKEERDGDPAMPRGGVLKDGQPFVVGHAADHGDDHGEGEDTTPELEWQKLQVVKPGRVAELIREASADEYAGIQAAVAAAHAADDHAADDHAADDHAGDDHAAVAHAPAEDDHGPGPNPIQAVAGPELLSLWKEHSYDGHKWGMAIDLSSCTGCNACVIACQSENNIPVVGKEQVLMGREMQWLRLDTYFVGESDEPEVRHQPLTCIQCEMAPCEQVCPVAATVHSDEGLNDMVYNRCIGTRYCSNNCPVKVRRFNFFNYHRELKREENAVKTLAYNPEVTVRHRGVMEKCTYCVQRIQGAKIQAKVEGNRDMRDGDVVTACQQTCPADAIMFGDLADPESQVSKLHALDRRYDLLAFLNLKPRTAYLARITNPNPALRAEPVLEAAAH